MLTLLGYLVLPFLMGHTSTSSGYPAILILIAHYFIVVPAYGYSWPSMFQMIVLWPLLAFVSGIIGAASAWVTRHYNNAYVRNPLPYEQDLSQAPLTGAYVCKYESVGRYVLRLAVLLAINALLIGGILLIEMLAAGNVARFVMLLLFVCAVLLYYYYFSGSRRRPKNGDATYQTEDGRSALVYPWAVITAFIGIMGVVMFITLAVNPSVQLWVAIGILGVEAIVLVILAFVNYSRSKKGHESD